MNLEDIPTPLVEVDDLARLRRSIVRMADAAEILAMLFPADESPREGHLKAGRRAMQRRSKGIGAPPC